MAALLTDVSHVVTAGPGTGAFALGAGATFAQIAAAESNNTAAANTFATAGAVDQTLYSYRAVGAAGREIGIGTYTASGTTLARTMILFSTNGGAAVSFGSDVVVSQCPLPADLTVNLATRSVPFASAQASVDLILPAGFKFYELIANEALPTSNGALIAFQVSQDGGATIKTDANYVYATGGSSGTGSAASQSYGWVTAPINNTYTPPLIRCLINPGGANGPSAQNYPSVSCDATYVDTSPSYRRDVYGAVYLGATGRINLIRIRASTGNISGGFTLRGIP